MFMIRTNSAKNNFMYNVTATWLSIYNYTNHITTTFTFVTSYHTDCTYFKNVCMFVWIIIIMVKIALARWRSVCFSFLYVFQERMDFCMDYYYG